MKENNWVDNLAARLVETGIATMETINGCSEEELLNIEKFYSLKLPEAYKDYMRKFGKASGDFLRECGIYYPSVLRNRRRATTLLNNNTDYKLKRSDFVFITRYGCQFYFFSVLLARTPIHRSFATQKTVTYQCSWLIRLKQQLQWRLTNILSWKKIHS
ncbi:MAG: SMI1/KNR4 family protein [Candidatus Obscuribacter sp.]|nr:SMI1/KNR4 family protein [Candidatus Obscuribacter sp.]